MASHPRCWNRCSFALAFALVVSVVGCRDDGASGRVGADGGGGVSGGGGAGGERDAGGADRGRDVNGLGACEGQDQPAGDDRSGNTRSCGSVTHRVAKNACAWPPPDDSKVWPPTALMDECQRNSDCVAKKHGSCGNTSGIGGASGNRCGYGCETDQDCPAGNVCQCHSAGGYCMAAGCATDADCSPGLLCAQRRRGCWLSPFDPNRAYDCQSPNDECASDSDCQLQGQECRLTVGGVAHLACQSRCPIP